MNTFPVKRGTIQEGGSFLTRPLVKFVRIGKMKAMGNNAAVCNYDRLCQAFTSAITVKVRWEGPSGPHRSVSEVPGMGTEAVEVPAQRSGAACHTGAVTAGDWGWTDRISSRNP